MFKIETQKLIFNKRRDFTLTTPCCFKKNKDGKFVNFKGYGNIYGYCHSCGTTSRPPILYIDEKRNHYHWNTVLQQFESVTLNVLQEDQNRNTYFNKGVLHGNNKSKHIDFMIVTKTINTRKENTLLQYLRSKYENKKVNYVKQLYLIGTSKKGGTVFWFINKNFKAQKAKVSYYTENGKRTNRFEVPYKNADGYLSCLFGEHLLKNIEKPIILVESEKTAIVGAIEFPKYTWLAYSGINGLTDSKLEAIKNRKVLIVPDISQNAVQIINKKIKKIRSLGIDVTIYDMTYGKSDQELKEENWYNCDLEDILRKSLN